MQNLQQVKAVIFDIDGTIMDSIGRIVECMQISCAQCGTNVPSVEACKNIIGLTLHKAVEILLPTESATVQDQVFETYKANYTKFENEQPTALFAGTEEVFAKLKCAGFKIGIATGKSRRGYNRIMGYTNLAQYIDVSVTGDEVRSKPDSQMLRVASDYLQLPVKACLMVGDSTLDIAMANNAHMLSAAVLTGVHDALTLATEKPTVLTDNITSLCALLLQESH